MSLRRFDPRSGNPTGVRTVLATICGITPEQVDAVFAILRAGLGHEDKLRICDEILETCGVEGLDLEGADDYQDGNIGCCPPFSYLNMGEAYATTLARDHEHGVWVVGCWADMLSDYEQAHKLGDWEEWAEEPESCPSCGKSGFELRATPNSSRGPETFSWICRACNRHCYAEEGFRPGGVEEET